MFFDGIIPLGTAVQSDNEACKEKNVEVERCLLYVALTRARILAYITGYGKLTRFLSD